MKTWKKPVIAIGAVVVLIVIVIISVKSNKDTVTVQTSNAVKGDITSLVTASGEIRAQNYTNVLGQGIGKITDIDVNEGDVVKKGAVLLRVEKIQPAAGVKAQQATVDSMQAGIQSAQAADVAAQADVQQAEANLEKAKNDWNRGQGLYNEGLIAKSDFDTYKSTYYAAVATLAGDEARAKQAHDQLAVAQYNAAQASATEVQLRDVLDKTVYNAPIAGVVTYIPVKVGEYVVPGIQNAEGSYLMTLADMSEVNAEVMVDEADVPNVKVGQQASITIDAYPGQVFKGHVVDVGEEAILRTSGLATTQQTSANSQEARDFKVHVRLDQPPTSIRLGLSCTARIDTGHRSNVVTIPIQALAMRTKQELEADQDKEKGGSGVTLAAAKPAMNADGTASTNDIQGVFVVRNSKAIFVPVQTGISGLTDIEVTSGLQPGDLVVTGSYEALRSLHSGATVKIDNSVPAGTS
jgi:HlyD family secretion protein